MNKDDKSTVVEDEINSVNVDDKNICLSNDNDELNEKNSIDTNKSDDENDLIYDNNNELSKKNSIDTNNSDDINIDFNTSSDNDNDLTYNNKNELNNCEILELSDKNVLIHDNGDNTFYKENIYMDDIIVTDYEINNLKNTNDDFNINSSNNINYYDINNNVIDYDKYMYLNIKKFLNNQIMDNLYYKIELDNLDKFSYIEAQETRLCIKNRYDYIIIYINNSVSLHIQYTYLYNTIIQFFVSLYFDDFEYEKVDLEEEEDYKYTVHLFLKKYSNYYQYNSVNIIRDKYKWWQFWKWCF